MKLSKLAWNITNKCNQGCRYCFRFDDKDILDKESHFNVIKNVKNLGVKELTYSGGECLLVPHLTELLEFSQDLGIKNSLNTNGKLLNDEKLSEIKGYLKQVNLSLDTLNDNTNNKIGRFGDHRETILNRIDLLKSQNLDVGVTTVVMQCNKDDIIELGQELSKYKLKRWKLLQFTPSRFLSKLHQKEFEISDNEFNKVVEQVKHLFSNELLASIESRSRNYFNKDYGVITPDCRLIVMGQNCDHDYGDLSK